MGADQARLGGADDLGQGVGGGFRDAFHGAEPLQQFLFGGGADPFYLRELAYDLPFGASVAVVGDAEAVCLVAQVLHHAQRFGILVDIERHGVAGEIYLLQAFGNPYERHFSADADLVESLHGGRELPLAAVHHH